MARLGFVGFGSLGQLLGAGFSVEFEIYYYDPNIIVEAYKKINSIEDLVQTCDVIIIATPSSSFEEVIKALAQLDLNNKLIVDVLSAKTFALEIYRKYLSGVDILSLHPLFGPPSFDKFQAGLRWVSCLCQGKKAVELEEKLQHKYRFKIIRKSATEHDKHMAVHHAVPFFLAHALSKTDFKKDPGDLTIPSEEKLRKIVEIAGKESKDLYLTIMKSNPHAKKAVDDFLQTAASEHSNLWP